MKNGIMKSIISIILAAVLAVVTPSVLSVGAESSERLANPRITPDNTTNSGQSVIYDTVYIGSYPQSEVTGEALTLEIITAVYNENQETVIDGVKYRRIKRADATNPITDNNFDWKIGGDEEGYHYFRYEPLRWRVLSVDDGKAFLLSDMVIDTQLYHPRQVRVTWETCTIRSWLNGYSGTYNLSGINYTKNNFMDVAFTATEQAAIVETSLTNEDNTRYEGKGGNNTVDRIFFMSEAEMYNRAYGFHDYYYNSDEARMGRPTTYALAMGTYIYTDEKVSGNTPYYGSTFWWLRSPGKNQTRAAGGDDDGWIDTDGHYVFRKGIGVRPAMWIDISQVDAYEVGKRINTARIVKGEPIPDEEEDTNSEAESQYIDGDVDFDKDVDLTDARIILKAALRIEALNEEQSGVADLDEDSDITLADAQRCLKMAFT